MVYPRPEIRVKKRNIWIVGLPDVGKTSTKIQPLLDRFNCYYVQKDKATFPHSVLAHHQT